jgi:hypothetical protein
MWSVQWNRGREGMAFLLRMPARGRHRLASFAVAGFLLGACGPGADADPQPGVDDAEYRGLTREEIELQAESMTPEEAERLGIVDTTIRLEAPIHPDSVIHLEEGHILPVDTAPRE